jgi:hypothetical protein
LKKYKKVAFRTRNTIQNTLKPHSQIYRYKESGIYQMKCIDCPLKYVRQMGRTLSTRYREHTFVQAIMNNNGNSEYSNHILSTTHIWESNRINEHHKNREKRKIHYKNATYIKSVKQTTLEYRIFIK